MGFLSLHKEQMIRYACVWEEIDINEIFSVFHVSYLLHLSHHGFDPHASIGKGCRFMREE